MFVSAFTGRNIMIKKQEDGGHWYDSKGQPRHTVPYADPDKGMRPTNLRDARKLDLSPSVTSIIKCVQDFRHYAEQQVVLASLTLPEIAGEPADSRMQRILRDAHSHMNEARDTGIAIHNELRKALARETGYKYADLINPVLKQMAKLRAAMEGDRWEAELSFSCPLGYGGQIDAIMYKDDKPICIVDFKTKAFGLEDLPKKRLTYDEHAMQLVAYAHGMGNVSANLINIFISTSEPGTNIIHQWEPEHNARWFAAFSGLLSYWQHSKDFHPHAEREPGEEG